MAFNGSGTFVRLYNWVSDATAGIFINAPRMDAETDGIASGLSNCITRDGQGVPSANLPMAGFKHTGAAAAVATGQYLLFGQTAASLSGLTSTSDTLTYKGILATAAGQAGLFVGDETGARKLEFWYFGSANAGAYGVTGGNVVINAPAGTNGLNFSTSDLLRMRITAAGIIQDANGLELGYKGSPASATITTLVAADNGKTVPITANMAVPNAVFAAGNEVHVYNNTAGALSLTAGITTLRFAGSASTGARTLAQRAMARIWFVSGTEAVVDGTGVT